MKIHNFFFSFVFFFFPSFLLSLSFLQFSSLSLSLIILGEFYYLYSRKPTTHLFFHFPFPRSPPQSRYVIEDNPLRPYYQHSMTEQVSWDLTNLRETRDGLVRGTNTLPNPFFFLVVSVLWSDLQFLRLNFFFLHFLFQFFSFCFCGRFAWSSFQKRTT